MDLEKTYDDINWDIH